MTELWGTRIVLKNRNRETARMLGDVNFLHGFTLTAYPAAAAREVGLLWRADRDSTGTPVVLAQSTVRPNTDTWTGHEAVETVSTPVNLADKMLPRIRTGDTWRIQGRVCATITRNDHRRTPLVNPDDLLRWLVAQARGGFTLATDPFWEGEDSPPDMAVDHEGRVFSVSKGATFNSTKMRGTVVVGDEARFAELLLRGIGRGKAFGFGLLQATPV